MTFLTGLPSFVSVLAIVYLAAESGSRWVALVACGGLFAGLLVGLRREARRRVQGGAEARHSSRSEKASSAMQQ